MNHSRVLSHRLWIAAVLAFIMASATSAQLRGGAGGWMRLGDSHVDGHNDHDKIKVSDHGPFVNMRLHVSGSAVKFDHLIVHFSNGQNEQVAANFVVRSGSDSPSLIVPGTRRNVDSVEMWYERGSWSSKPQVTLYGRK